MEGVDSFDDLTKLKGFKIVHLNVRSIVKKIDQLRVLLSNSKLDVITISETWLREHLHSRLVEIDGYNVHRLDRIKPRKKGKGGSVRGGGLLSYVSTSHSSSCEILSDLDNSDENLEAQWTLIHRPHSKNILICNQFFCTSKRSLPAYKKHHQEHRQN